VGQFAPSFKHKVFGPFVIPCRLYTFYFAGSLFLAPPVTESLRQERQRWVAPRGVLVVMMGGARSDGFIGDGTRNASQHVTTSHLFRLHQPTGCGNKLEFYRAFIVD